MDTVLLVRDVRARHVLHDYFYLCPSGVPRCRRRLRLYGAAKRPAIASAINEAQAEGRATGDPPRLRMGVGRDVSE